MTQRVKDNFFKFLAPFTITIIISFSAFFGNMLYEMSSANARAVIEQRVFQEGLNASLAATINQLADLKDSNNAKYTISDVARDQQLQKERDVHQDSMIKSNLGLLESNSRKISEIEDKMKHTLVYINDLEQAISRLQYNSEILFHKNNLPIPQKIQFKLRD